MTKRCISYLRVSTQQQGRSGLGINAQRKAVSDYLATESWQQVEEIIETESGRKSDRPALRKALSLCRIHSASLVVAKVDRLTRSSAFLHQLLDAGVDIAFCDLPQLSGPTGKFLLNQMAAVAELEAAMISQRTKAALAAAKERGAKLGTPGNATPEGRARGYLASLASRREAAAERLKDIAPLVVELVEGEGLSLRAAADKLNSQGVRTRRGAKWSATQVSRVIKSVRATSGPHARSLGDCSLFLEVRS